jgi:hypothetical protein
MDAGAETWLARAANGTRRGGSAGRSEPGRMLVGAPHPAECNARRVRHLCERAGGSGPLDLVAKMLAVATRSALAARRVRSG